MNGLYAGFRTVSLTTLRVIEGLECFVTVGNKIEPEVYNTAI